MVALAQLFSTFVGTPGLGQGSGLVMDETAVTKRYRFLASRTTC